MSSERTEGQPPEGIKKVALVGFAESWKEAPFDDHSIDIVGLNELWKYVPRWTHWFEVHDAETLGITKRNLEEGEQKRHLEWLQSQPPGKPIYMQPQFCTEKIPAAVPMPLDAMIARTGLRYFTSSIGYMIAWALLNDYQWIGLYGIDLASDVEYVHQRPNAEYLIGLARGEGRTVVMAESSAICKAGHLYGFEKPLGEGGGIVDAVKNHKAMLTKKHDETLAMLNTLEGAMQETDNFIQLHEFKERGVTLRTY